MLKKNLLIVFNASMLLQAFDHLVCFEQVSIFKSSLIVS